MHPVVFTMSTAEPIGLQWLQHTARGWQLTAYSRTMLGSDVYRSVSVRLDVEVEGSCSEGGRKPTRRAPVVASARRSCCFAPRQPLTKSTDVVGIHGSPPTCFSCQIRNPCCRKGTARCRSCSFRFKVCRQHSLQV